MIKINEQHIDAYLKEFNKRDITINIKGILIAEVKMPIARCMYDRNIGILHFSCSQVKFEFNASELYRMTINISGEILEMYFDNGISVTIVKE